jgi:hypothetical protein
MADMPFKRSRVVRWVAAAAVTAALVGTAFWFQRAGAALSSIEVLPQSLRCDGKDVPITLPADDASDDVVPRATFETRIDVDSECWLTVAVANTGTRTVTIESMTFPGLMPGSPTGALLETTGDASMTPPRELDPDGEGRGKAVYAVDESVGPGAWTSLAYRIGYRADGATCPGVTAFLRGFPVAHAKVAGRSADVVGSVSITHPSVKTKANQTDCG